MTRGATPKTSRSKIRDPKLRRDGVNKNRKGAGEPVRTQWVL